MKTRILVGCFLAWVVVAQAHAADCIKNADGDVVCGKGPCAADQYGKVFCAGAGGGAMRDQYGDVKCGVGSCAKDDLGEIWCSAKPGGGAATNSNGKVKCLGQCRRGTKQLCEAAR
jgi:hypothetical protein